jgi:hypothetical protein
MDFNSDFKYDLKVGQLKELELGKIFSNSKIEVKYDLKASKTGNVFVEYQSRGKSSGLSTSESDYYCFCFESTYHLISSKELKNRCRKYFNTNRDVVGGDSNTSKGILLPTKELL